MERRQPKEPRLGSQLEDKSLKAKGAATQGTAGRGVEESGGTAQRFLCTKEVRTPKAKPNWGKTLRKSEILEAMVQKP